MPLKKLILLGNSADCEKNMLLKIQSVIGHDYEFKIDNDHNLVPIYIIKCDLLLMTSESEGSP